MVPQINVTRISIEETPVSLEHGDEDPETARSNPAPQPSPSPCSLFPPELWLSIFSYLDTKALKTVTQTYSPFRSLAQPLLFRVLDFCPFFLSYNTDRPILRPRRYLQWTLERLEFYKSSRIAPYVRELWVSPYSRNGFPSRRLTDDLDPALIISAIMEALPSFPSIRTLSWHCIDIHCSWWMAIQQLSLTRLWINSCTILSPPLISPCAFTSQLPVPLRCVRHLDLDQWAWEGRVTNHVSIHEERLSGVDPLILGLVLHSESIRTVSAPRHDTALRLLSTLTRLGMDIPCTLLSITIPYSSTKSDDFIPALIQCDALKELHILPPSDDHTHDPKLQGRIPDSSIPYLDTYDGPYDLLPAFVNIEGQKPRLLRFIGLWGLDHQVTMTVCDPRRLVPILEGLTRWKESLEALEIMSLILTHVTIELAILLSRFSNLKEVTIESQDSLIPTRPLLPHSTLELSPESPITVLFKILQSHRFPSSLKHLTLTTHLKNSNNLDFGTERLEAARFLEGLGEVNPKLETIDLRYGTYWTGTVIIKWYRRLPRPENSWGSGNLQADPDWGSDNLISSLDNDEAPSLSRSSTASASSVTSADSDNTQAAVEKFLALPSKPKITTTIDLDIGRMTFTEQKRAVVLPERSLPLEEAKVVAPGFGLLVGGVNRIWRLVGRVRRIIGGNMGFVRG